MLFSIVSSAFRRAPRGGQSSPRESQTRERVKAMDRLRVLVVDDEEVVRYPLEEFFRFRNDACSLATSGEEAMRLLGNTDFDLMITDISMPGMSGLELITHARKLLHGGLSPMADQTSKGHMRAR